MAMIVIAAVTAAVDVGLSLRRLLHEPKNQLPQLRDLRVMSSASGAPVQFGYGCCRVAGNLIWTPGLEYDIRQGKKGTGGTDYVFVGNWGVAFGEGPGTILRIWGDGKIMYDSNPAQSSTVPISDYPAWIPSQNYQPGNQVAYANNIWQALKINKSSAPGVTNPNWNEISTYPAYEANVEYFAGDVVSFNGQIYVCQIANNNGSTGVVYPDSGKTATVNGIDTVYWIVLDQLYPVPIIYPGDNNQTPDPIIQAAEGSTYVSGNRGLIYCRFNNVPLANFADRIPSCTADIQYTKVNNIL